MLLQNIAYQNTQQDSPFMSSLMNYLCKKLDIKIKVEVQWGTYLQNALKLPPGQGYSNQPWCEDSRK